MTHPGPARSAALVVGTDTAPCTQALAVMLAREQSMPRTPARAEWITMAESILALRAECASLRACANKALMRRKG